MSDQTPPIPPVPPLPAEFLPAPPAEQEPGAPVVDEQWSAQEPAEPLSTEPAAPDAVATEAYPEAFAAPTEAYPPAHDAPITEGYPPSYSAQPTEAYPPAYGTQPTEAYPAAYGAQPTEAYPGAYAAPGVPTPPAQPYGAPAQTYGAPAQPYGAPAQPYGAPGYTGHTAPYSAPSYPQYGNAVPLPQSTPNGPSTLGLVALLAAIVSLVASTVLSSIGVFNAAAGAVAHASGFTESDFESLQPDQLLGFLSPVRGWVLMTEIGFWAGTALGIWALIQGIIAIVKRRGRVMGIIAIIIAVIAPFIYGSIVYVVFFAGLATGVGGMDLPNQP